MNEKTKKRRFVLRAFLYCIFGVIFLVSTGITAATLVAHYKADRAIQELRIQARNSLNGSGMNVIIEEPEELDQPENSEETSAEPRVPVRQQSMDFSGLLQVNSEIIGWLFAEGTNIDYPVLHTNNNDYYLNHLYNRENNGSGSLFADYRNRGDFTDRNTVIYGHHMGNGSMFGSLEAYRSQDFYEAAPTMMLYTPNGDYLIELICGTDESGDNEFVEFEFQTDEEFLQYVERLCRRSTFQSNVTVRPDDRLVSMCTCAYVFNNARYMLVGRLVELNTTDNAALHELPVRIG